MKENVTVRLMRLVKFCQKGFGIELVCTPFPDKHGSVFELGIIQLESEPVVRIHVSLDIVEDRLNTFFQVLSLFFISQNIGRIGVFENQLEPGSLNTQMLVPSPFNLVESVITSITTVRCAIAGNLSRVCRETIVQCEIILIPASRRLCSMFNVPQSSAQELFLLRINRKTTRTRLLLVR